MKKPAQDKQVTKEMALQKLMQYCAYRERSESEVLTKLRQWNIPSAAIGTIVENLKKEGFLNNARFSKSYAGGKFNSRKWGKVKIKSMLAAAAVSPEEIQSALAQIPDAIYRQTLSRLLEQKLSALKSGTPMEKKAKVVRYGVSKGYEPELVWQEVNRIFSD